MRYKRKVTVITAVQQTIGGTNMTMEGELTYQAGDFVITGVKGEKYAVQSTKFHSLYDHIGGDQYRRRPSTVEATELVHPICLFRYDGEMHGKMGDFLITNTTDGSQYVVDREIFSMTYELD